MARESNKQVSPGRLVAYRVLRRAFEDRAWVDRTLYVEARKLALDSRDQSFAMQLCFGSVQRKRTLDWLIEELSGRSIKKVQPQVLAILRLGLYQLVFLDRVPAHAVVDESVRLAKIEARPASGLVNAVLRKGSRDARRMVESLLEATTTDLGLKFSYPNWIIELWVDAFGLDATKELLLANNNSAEFTIRVNTLRTTRDQLVEKLGTEWSSPQLLPEAIEIKHAIDLYATPYWEEGLFLPQSRAAMMVSRVLDPQPGERVLDLCAAPGAKTTHIAQLMQDEGELIAVEKNPKRAGDLQRTIDRMNVSCATVRLSDAAKFSEEKPFDRVLVDPPCSDLGTLRSRPDVRWNKSPVTVDAVCEDQRMILDCAAKQLKQGGVLVYSTCTLSPRENEQMIDRFLVNHPEFVVEPPIPAIDLWQHPNREEYALSLPSRDGTDGFFFARLRKL